MKRNGKILVTGASGMVGSALKTKLEIQYPLSELLTPSHRELELENRDDVMQYFNVHKPDYVFMIAAKVGGIEANRNNPVDFFVKNMRIELNLFEACFRFGVDKSLFLGSSCIYPRECSQPMREQHLLTGPLEPTNEGYALAKISGLKLAEYYNKQYGMITVCPMPCNIYGTGDSFNPKSSHVVSALVKKFVDACSNNLEEVTVWGTGSAKREFIHVNDAVDGILFIMNNFDSSEPVNLGTGKDISIYDLTNLIAKLAGFKGKINWDSKKPDGMPLKCLDISKLESLGFHAKISLEDGIKKTIEEYRLLLDKGVNNERNKC